MSFSIHTRAFASFATNAVVVADKDAKKLVLFDAPLGVDAFIKEFSGYSFEALFLTHGHFDHILGVPAIAPKQIYGHGADKKLFTRPEIMSAWMTPEESGFLREVKVTHWLTGKETFNIAGLEVQVKNTPGHSQGSVIYYLPQLNAAIVGDCIFKEGIGRTDLPGGSSEALIDSIHTQILTLPENTILYSGHGPTTTVGEEKRNNSYLAAQ